MREIQQRVRQYELMAVFSPDVTEEELPAAIDRVGGYITIAGGEIVSVNHESPWGRRRLAYSIRYQGRDVRDGYYVLYYFDIQSTQVAEIEREIGLNDKLIRHILTIRGEIPVVAEPEEGAEAASAPAEAVAAPVQAAAVPVEMTVAPAEEPAPDDRSDSSPVVEAASPAIEDMAAGQEPEMPAESVETETADEALAEPAAPAEPTEN